MLCARASQKFPSHTGLSRRLVDARLLVGGPPPPDTAADPITAEAAKLQLLIAGKASDVI